MSELDLDALEQAAREAGGGRWFSTGWTVGSRGFEVGDLKSRDRICSDATERCAEFIAAANPATILELLDRLEAAEKERDALRNEIAFVKEVEFPRKAQAVADAWEGKCKRLEVERDALRWALQCLLDALPSATTHPAIIAVGTAIALATGEQP